MTSSTLVGDAVSTHGFSTQFIEDVVSNCSVLFTVGDVLHTCTVFTLSHAQRTFTKFFNRHRREVWCNPAGDQICHPGLNSPIVFLHYLLIYYLDCFFSCVLMRVRAQFYFVRVRYLLI